ncbi:MAG: HAD family phosphatase [bacterium]|nr:HAD family phosphatase [bacterium]
MIRNIVFDIGNVMVYFRWRELMEELSFSDDVIERLEHGMIMTELWNELDRGILPEDEVIAKMKENNEGLEHEIDLLFANAERIVEQFEYTQQWLNELKARGYNLYYLSNYQRSFFECHKEKVFQFLPLMDGGVVSAYVKLLKPDYAIYKKLLTTYGLRAEECVFLDDTKVNITAAKEVGMNGIVFDTYEQASKELEKILAEK